MTTMDRRVRVLILCVAAAALATGCTLLQKRPATNVPAAYCCGADVSTPASARAVLGLDAVRALPKGVTRATPMVWIDRTEDRDRLGTRKNLSSEAVEVTADVLVLPAGAYVLVTESFYRDQTREIEDTSGSVTKIVSPVRIEVPLVLDGGGLYRLERDQDLVTVRTAATLKEAAGGSSVQF